MACYTVKDNRGGTVATLEQKVTGVEFVAGGLVLLAGFQAVTEAANARFWIKRPPADR